MKVTNLELRSIERSTTTTILEYPRLVDWNMKPQEVEDNKDFFILNVLNRYGIKNAIIHENRPEIKTLPLYFGSHTIELKWLFFVEIPEIPNNGIFWADKTVLEPKTGIFKNRRIMPEMDPRNYNY